MRGAISLTSISVSLYDSLLPSGNVTAFKTKLSFLRSINKGNLSQRVYFKPPEKDSRYVTENENYIFI